MRETASGGGSGLTNPETFAARLAARLHAVPMESSRERPVEDASRAAADDLHHLHLNWDTTAVGWEGAGERTALRTARFYVGRVLGPLQRHLAAFHAAITRVLDGHERALAAMRVDIDLLATQVGAAVERLEPDDPNRLSELTHAAPARDHDVSSRQALLASAAQEFTHGPVLDLRCGRGDLLGRLRPRDIAATGVDDRWDYVTVCRERALTAFTRDWAQYLDDLPAASVAGIFVPQLLERLTPLAAARLLVGCSRVLAPGGVLVIELVDSAYVHADLLLDGVRPIPAESLMTTLRQLGMTAVRYLRGPESESAQVVDDVLIGPCGLCIARHDDA